MPEAFDVRVAEELRRLRSGDWASRERETCARRLTWLEGRGRPDSVTPRAAFEALFFDYMGLAAEDLPVRAESDTEIVFESRNPCPTLAACEALDLDTRVVCRRLYEKPTQAFLSGLDPELRFSRDYAQLRPRTPFCLERIARMDFAVLMGVALDEARVSLRSGNKGYGAVVVRDGQVIARARDTAGTENDPSLHAEVNAIRSAVAALGDPDLSGAVLFSTCEPCPMCSSLAVWANLTTVVYGASIAETRRLGRTRIEIGAAEVARRSPVLLEVVGSVLEQECLELYR